MYKIKEIAKMAGVSSRTLRYYHEINLLNPSYINESGYRIYSEKQLDLLQQILFYRRMDLPLSEIKKILNDQFFDLNDSLVKHRENLVKQKDNIEVLLNTIDKTIAYQKGETKMKSKDKFEGLKDEMIKEVDEKYGDELRDSYGSEAINEGFTKFKKMTKYQMDSADQLAEDILNKLSILLPDNDPSSNEGQELCKMHEKWIKYYWPTYSKEAHLALTKMYTTDKRFTAYYDKVGVGASLYLFKAMEIYLK